MQTGSNLTTKDKITAQLPGHQLQDKNMNGVPDRLETRSNTTGLGATGLQGGANDRNGNGIPDNLEGRHAPRSIHDLNGNGIPDSMERRGLATGMQGGMTDLNRNGIPDQLEQRGLVGQSFNQGGMTDLNRNGIPDQLEGQGFGFVGSVTAVQTSVVDVRQAPVVVERIEKPAVVHEVYKTEEVVQIQPIIERERNQVDVYEVIQPMREREVIATEVRQATLPAQTRAVVVEDNSAFLATRSAPSDFSTREVVATRSQVVENAPIIHETIVHKVIEEVQPVIYKEIDRPILIKETLPIYEKIVEAPHAHHTVLPMRDLGVRTVTTTTTTGYTDLNRDGIPDQLQGGMYQTTGMHSGITSQGFINQGLQGGLNDRNGNGIPDNLEQRGFVGQSFNQGGMTDLNRNGIPDSMERRGVATQGLGMQGGVNDRNGNGIPDNLEGRHARSIHDLNGNGIPDRLEKGHGLNDLNGNGIPDSMERRGLTNQGIGMQGQQYGQQYGQPSGLLSQPTAIPSGTYGTGMQGLQGGLNDRNGNGIPDNMEKRRDLNGNGIPDQLEQRMGATTLNTNTRL